jgi:hypothetical protein
MSTRVNGLIVALYINNLNPEFHLHNMQTFISYTVHSIFPLDKEAVKGL